MDSCHGSQVVAMDAGSFIVVLINFLLIGILPIVFFKRDGKLNPMWWLTASPFLISSGSVIASFAGYFQHLSGYQTQTTAILQMISAALNIGSISLIAFSLGTHRIPI